MYNGSIIVFKTLFQEFDYLVLIYFMKTYDFFLFHFQLYASDITHFYLLNIGFYQLTTIFTIIHWLFVHNFMTLILEFQFFSIQF